MNNHYHLMIETPQGNLSRGMRQLNGMYTQRFNRNHNRVGHVFQGRFKSIVVDKDAYLLELSRYIVRNPVAVGLVKGVSDWSWSSYRAMVGMVKSPPFLQVDFVGASGASDPWQSLNGPDVLGDDEFCRRLPSAASSDNEIPKRKRVLRHLPLADIASKHEKNSEWMREAYREHGYTMRAIAEYAELHHSTVSRLIKKGENNAPNKI